MILKTKYGTEIDTEQMGQGFGEFGKYVRENVDSEWGMDKERQVKKTKKYRVELSGNALVTADIEVEAVDEEEAKELALKEDLYWSVYEKPEDITVDYIEVVK